MSGNSNTSRGLRCAIYTRMSTEEGLDQDFNSIDARQLRSLFQQSHCTASLNTGTGKQASETNGQKGENSAANGPHIPPSSVSLSRKPRKTRSYSERRGRR